MEGEEFEQTEETAAPKTTWPHAKQLVRKVLFVKMWTITYKGEELPDRDLIVFEDIDRIVELLNDAYLRGKNDQN